MVNVKLIAGVVFVLAIAGTILGFMYWPTNETTSAAAAGYGQQQQQQQQPNTDRATDNTDKPTDTTPPQSCTYTNMSADPYLNRFRPNSSAQRMPGKEYPSLAEAQAACTADQECGVVYNFNHGSMNFDGFAFQPKVFYLFKKGATFTDIGVSGPKAYPWENQRNGGGVCA